MAITERDRIRWLAHRHAAPNADYLARCGGAGSVTPIAHITLLRALRRKTASRRANDLRRAVRQPGSGVPNALSGTLLRDLSFVRDLHHILQP